MKKTIASHMVDMLIAHDYTNLYCVPGVQNDDFFDALYDHQEVLPPIHARHEQGASYMALGAALATGQPQVFSIVPGPGFLNGATALATAYSTNAPVLAMIGHIPAGAIDKGIGLLHEIPKQTEILSSLSKSTTSLRSGAGAKQKISKVFTDMISGRPRPVGLEIPVNVWTEEMDDGDSDFPVVQRPNPTVNPSGLARAVALIKGAKNPMIAVGGGAQGIPQQGNTPENSISALITQFAQAIAAPVTCNRMGKGVVSDRHPLAINNPVAHALWADVDLVIGLGSRLQNHRMMWGMDESIKVIHVDIDGDELNRISSPTVGICGDVGDVVGALLQELGDRPHGREDWLTQVAQTKAQVMATLHHHLAPQMGYINAIRTSLPDGGILVEELTQIGYVSRMLYPTYQPRTYISHGYQGTLGWGLATALGVAHARRDVPVVSMSGDGGFMFTMPELATAVYHKIPLNIVLFNDNAFGNVKRFQIENYNNRAIASDLANPDFVQLVDSFGIPATRVNTAEGLQQHLTENIAQQGPTFIEVSVGDFPSPWDFILLNKVRG